MRNSFCLSLESEQVHHFSHWSNWFGIPCGSLFGHIYKAVMLSQNRVEWNIKERIMHFVLAFFQAIPLLGLGVFVVEATIRYVSWRYQKNQWRAYVDGYNKNRDNWKYSRELQDDKEVVLYELKNCFDGGGSVNYVSYRLKNDRDVILTLAKRLYSDRLLKNLDGDTTVMYPISSEFATDKEIMYAALSSSPDVITMIPPEWLKDKECIRAVLKNSMDNPSHFRVKGEWIDLLDYLKSRIPREYLKDQDFMIELMGYNQNVYEIVGWGLKNDIKFALKALEKHLNLVSILSTNSSLVENEEFVMNAIKLIDSKNVFWLLSRFYSHIDTISGGISFFDKILNLKPDLLNYFYFNMLNDTNKKITLEFFIKIFTPLSEVSPKSRKVIRDILVKRKKGFLDEIDLTMAEREKMVLNKNFSLFQNNDINLLY